MTPRPGRSVGIDIGGTKIAVATVNGGRQILHEVAFPTEPTQGFASGIRRIGEAVTHILAESGWRPRDLSGIGIGCAGPVDPVRGTIHNPYTLPGWTDADVVAPLRSLFGCRVVLENDADMALLGECRAGAGRGFDPVVMLTFGTGIGGAALVGGALLRGSSGGHPELGHVPTDPSGPECYCGIRGCFESLASGTAMAGAARAAGMSDPTDLLARAWAGDAAAARIRETALVATSRAAWTILHTVLPARIVLGGGMMDEHYDVFAAAVLEAIARATLVPKGSVTVARGSFALPVG